MPTVNKLLEGLQIMKDGGHGETHVYFLSEQQKKLLPINSMSVEMVDEGIVPVVILGLC